MYLAAAGAGYIESWTFTVIGHAAPSQMINRVITQTDEENKTDDEFFPRANGWRCPLAIPYQTRTADLYFGSSFSLVRLLFILLLSDAVICF